MITLNFFNTTLFTNIIKSEHSFTFNAPYALSAIAQGLSAILVIIITVRLIILQVLRYRIPPKYFLSPTRLEILISSLFILTIMLSLTFILVGYYFETWILIVATFLCLLFLFTIVRSIGEVFAIENIINKLKIIELKEIKEQKKNKVGNVVAKTHIYDIALQAYQNKDYYTFRLCLETLLEIAPTLAAEIINNQIGRIGSIVAEDRNAFEIVCNILYYAATTRAAKSRGGIKDRKTQKPSKDFSLPDPKIFFETNPNYNSQVHVQCIYQFQNYIQSFRIIADAYHRIAYTTIAERIIDIIHDELCRRKALYIKPENVEEDIQSSFRFERLYKLLIEMNSLEPYRNAVDETIENFDGFKEGSLFILAPNIKNDFTKDPRYKEWMSRTRKIERIGIDCWLQFKKEWTKRVKKQREKLPKDNEYLNRE